MIVEQLHLKRLKELGINICTKYKKDDKILQRDTNNTKNDNIKDAICLEKNYYKDGLYLDKVTGFDPRINYTYISNGDGENEVVCPNCGKISKQKEIGDFCPYCKTNYNMEYNDKDLGTKYHYDRVVQGVNYRKITLIVDVLISSIIVYLYIATNSRTFNIYDISKILVGTVILSLILYYFFYIIDASIIVLPIKIYKDKINKNQMKFWSMMEQKNVTKKIFYNNVNYELQKYYYGEDSNNKNIIDYDIIDYISIKEESLKSDKIIIKAKIRIREIELKENKINKKVVVKSFYFEKNNGEMIKTKEGSNIIKCNNCRSICRYSKRKM